MAPKRKRVVTVYTHCTTCGHEMDDSPDCVDWHAVYVCQRLKAHMFKTGQIPSQEKLNRIADNCGSDPCDDCCCGGCGSRKAQPGVECC